MFFVKLLAHTRIMETLNPASIFGNSNWLMSNKNCSKRWTKEENKRFESALAMVDEKTPDRWYRVAAMIPGKSVSDVIHQYNELVADVSSIEAGLVPDPDPDPSGYSMMKPTEFTLDMMENQRFDGCRKRGRSCDQERKKGIPWTEEEHRRFLMGLQAHGKGDWRNISRNYVISKTPTQVASHAQKYFLRQISGGKDKKRPSIHDITTVNLLQKLPSDDQKEKKPTNTGSNTNDGLLMGFDSTHCSNRSTGSLFDIMKHNDNNNNNNNNNNNSHNCAANLCAAANSKFSFSSAKYVHG